MKPGVRRKALSFLIDISKPYAKWYVFAAACSIVGVPVALLQTILTARLIDGVSADGGLSWIAPLALVTILFAGIAWLGELCGARLSALSSVEMKSRVANALLYGDFRRVSALRAGDALRTLSADTKAVTDFLSGQLVSLASQALQAIGALALLFWLNPILACITLLYIPFGMTATLYINKRLQKLYPEEAERSGQALSVTEQALSALPVIKTFAMEKRMLARIRNAFQKQAETGEKIGFWQGWLQPACYSVSHMPRMAYMVFAGKLVFDGKLSPGMFLAVLEMVNFFIGPAVYFPFLMNGLNQAMASMKRVKSLCDIGAVTVNPVNARGESISVRLEDVRFSYDRGEVLSGFDLYREGAGITALAGPSGGGKSTVIRLLARLIQPESGEIQVCGSVGCVPQETWLFRGTLYDNIICANPETPKERVYEAARLTGLDALAQSLPEGYDTLLGDGGAEFSGGQKKRLSFARLLLRDADIWLLDEPDASLDAESAESLAKLITEQSHDKRVILAAHSERMLSLTEDIVTVKAAKKGGGNK